MPGTRPTEITREQLNAANKRSISKRGPRAVVARYDSRDKRVVVTFASGIELRIPPGAIQGLKSARVRDLREIVISPSGQGIHFPAIDADVFLPALLGGKTGSSAWMAAEIGRAGGAVSSEAKAAAARENGKKGGRPRKTLTVAA